MPVLAKSEWPSCLRGPLLLNHIHKLAGIFVGGCVERGDGSRFRAKAHAHTSGDRVGWICVLSAKRLCSVELMLHEFAHVATLQGHTDKWRKLLVEIGGTLDEVPGLLKSYHKIKRGPPNPIIWYE